jgi:DNA replication licensing factor MCM7
MGHIPRSMTVYLFHDTTRQMTAGDIVTVSGVLLPKVYRGFRALRAGLLTEPYMEVMHVDLLKKQYTQYTPTDELNEKVDAMARDPSIYDKLAKSIAPEIYGHEDVKKALLLLMIGGVTHQGQDGMKIRGTFCEKQSVSCKSYCYTIQ